MRTKNGKPVYTGDELKEMLREAKVFQKDIEDLYGLGPGAISRRLYHKPVSEETQNMIIDGIRIIQEKRDGLQPKVENPLDLVCATPTNVTKGRDMFRADWDMARAILTGNDELLQIARYRKEALTHGIEAETYIAQKEGCTRQQAADYIEIVYERVKKAKRPVRRVTNISRQASAGRTFR